MPNGIHPGPESGIHRPFPLLSKDLQAYADSPDFHFTVDKIRSFLSSKGIAGVVELVRLGALEPSEIRRMIAICESDPENENFVTDLRDVLEEQRPFEHFFEVENQIKLVRTGSDLHSLMITGVKGFDKDTLEALLMLYEEGRVDPDGECKEKIKSALEFV